MGAYASRSKHQTRETYEVLLAAYRDKPAGHLEASRRAGITKDQARQTWEVGWPKIPWAKPIRVLVEAERLDAQAELRRAQMRAEEEAESMRELARQRSVEVRRQEDQILEIGRQDVTAALVLSAELVPAMRELVAEVTRQIKADPSKVPLGAAMKLIAAHTQMVQRTTSAATAILEATRLDRGAATSNVNVNVTHTASMSEEEALAELSAIEQILTDQTPTARARKLLASAPPAVIDAEPLPSREDAPRSRRTPGPSLRSRLASRSA